MSVAYYFTMRVSRPINSLFYNKITRAFGLGENFPHDQPIHSGICIINQETNEIEYTIEGYPNQQKELYLDVNRQTTIAKLQNTPLVVPQSNGESILQQGNWHQDYEITLHHLSDDTDTVINEANTLIREFKQHQPIPYVSYVNDCQTVTHHLIYRIKGETVDSPHPKSTTIDGMECTRGWGDGRSPIDIQKQLKIKDDIVARLPTFNR